MCALLGTAKRGSRGEEEIFFIIYYVPLTYIYYITYMYVKLKPSLKTCLVCRKSLYGSVFALQ